MTALPTIDSGATGPAVVELQKDLNKAGASPALATDGVYGPLTLAAVIKFKLKNGLTDGIVGPTTWALLEKTPPPPPPPTPVFTGNYPPNAHATYNAPAADPKLSLGGVTRLPYVDLDVWGPVSGETIQSSVTTVRNWTITANIDNSNGSVTCFPNAAQFPITGVWSNWSHWTSGWDEIMDTDPSIIASACYDNWFDNTQVGPTGQAVQEVMLHFDFRNRGAGPWVAQNVPFGGYTVNGVAIPKTYWSLAASGETCWWNLVDGNSNIHSMPVGAVDMLAMNKWLVAHGYLSATCNMTGFSLGYEICHTAGQSRKFTYNDLWWSAA